MQRYVISGKLIWQDDKFYYTTDGMYNKKWYRLPVEGGKNETKKILDKRGA